MLTVGGYNPNESRYIAYTIASHAHLHIHACACKCVSSCLPIFMILNSLQSYSVLQLV